MQRALIVIGIALILIGVAWPWIAKLGLGRLPGDIRIERAERELRGGDAVTVGLQSFDDGAPAGAVGPCAVYEDDVRASHGNLLFSGGRCTERVRTSRK